MTAQKHVVQFSGGLGSWATAQRVIGRHGQQNVVLLFADVLVEDEDLYRFNRDVERQLGMPITVVCDGRTPQEALRDRRWIGTARVAHCSELLKVIPCRNWLEENCDPAGTTLYVGIDWSEMHRIPTISRRWLPWTVECPLTEAPYLDKHGLGDLARAAGIEPPRLYGMGFPHNNCGGACVRGGQAHWARLLEQFPERFASWEDFEQNMQAELGTESTILRDRTGDTTRPLPLLQLRRRIETAREGQFDVDDWGACGCMTDEAPEPLGVYR